MIYLAFRNLFRCKRRSLTILLTLAFGAGALFAFQGFIEGVLTDYKESTLHTQCAHGQIHTLHYRNKVHKEPWKKWIDAAGEVQNFLEKQEEIIFVFPRVSFQALLKHGKNTAAALGQGIDGKKEAKFFHSLNIEQGENLSFQEEGILLGKGLAEALGVNIKDKVTVYTENIYGKASKVDLTVVGIFHTGAVDFDSRIFRLPLAKAAKLLKTERIENFSLALKEERDWQKIVERLHKKFPLLEATYFEEINKIYYKNSIDWLKAQYSIVEGIILAIVLLGISNSISSSILERKQEIGNLRANGESRFRIICLMLLEGGFLGLLGAFLGMSLVYTVFSYCLGEGIIMPPGPGSTRSFVAPFIFTPSMVMTNGGLCFLSAIFSSFLGTIRAVKVPIAKALKSY